MVEPIKPRKPKPATDAEIASLREPETGLKVGASGFKPLIIPLIISAIVCFGMLNFTGMAVSKKDFETNILNIAGTIAEIQAQQATYALKTDLGTYAPKTSLNVYALKTDLGTYATKAELTAAKPDLSGYVTKAVYDKAVARIKALEDKLASTTTTTTTTGDATTSGGVTFTVTVSPTSPIIQTGSYPYFLSVSNSSGATKKVFIQATATLASQPYTYINPNVTESGTSFDGSTQLTLTTFSTTLSPPGGVGCFMINGISDGYLLIANGSTLLVPVTFNLEATITGSIWVVTFMPIPTAF